MTSREKRNLRLEIMRDRYNIQHLNSFEMSELIEENERVRERINNYLNYKNSMKNTKDSHVS